MAYTIKKVFFFITGSIVFAWLMYNRAITFHKSALESTAQAIVYPIIYTTSTISNYAKHLTAKRQSHQQLQQNYDKLQKEYSTLLDQFIILNSAKNHYASTQELRDFKSRYNFSSAALTKVIAKNFSDNGHYILVNKGSAHGIKPQMIAIYKLQIIGKVIDVTASYSKILCITDSHCKIASFANNTNAQGILVGTNTPNTCNLDYVSHLSAIQQNDLVFSSGQGTVFPEGFCVGKIVHHELKEKALYHEVKLEPLVDLTSLEYCLLINNEKVTLY